MAHRTDTGLYFDAEARAMERRDRELIPRRLVIAMFSLAIAVTLLVAFAVVTGKPLSGQPIESDIASARTITLTGDGKAARIVDVNTGEVLLNAENGGFVSVVIDGLERARLVSGVTDNPPVTLALYDTGRLSLHDPASGWRTELSSFGPGNTGVWIEFLKAK